MKNLYAALTYMGLGLISGLVYREYTKMIGAEGTVTQLGAVHTHLLALGMLMFLIMLALDATLRLSHRRSYTVFFWTYNAGVILTTALLAVRGVLTLQGKTYVDTSAAIPGIAGLGHILITLGLIALFVSLFDAVKEHQGRDALPGSPAPRG